MSTPLFRDEVVQARRARWLGAIVLDHPPGAVGGMALCALAATLVVGLLANGEYTRRTQVAGVLVPSEGTATLVAPVAGLVVAVHVAEDGAVQEHAALATVRVPLATAHGDDGAAIAAGIERRRAATRDTYGSRRRRLLRP